MKISKAHELFKASEKIFRCPACHSQMAFRNHNSLACFEGHCFDLSKYGYLNFVPSKAKADKTKYTRDFYESRRRTFQSDFYNPVKEAIQLILDNCPTARVLDAGCGEGFFTSALMKNCDAYAIDIQKAAIVLAAKESKHIKWIVGDLANIPLQSASIDVLLNIFAPASYPEFTRLLTGEGFVIKVIPGNRHFIELRERAKGQLHKEYSNERVLQLLSKNFDCFDRKRISYQLPVTKPQLADLIQMTPLMFNVNRDTLSLNDIECISLDIEIIVGKKYSSQQ